MRVRLGSVGPDSLGLAGAKLGPGRFIRAENFGSVEIFAQKNWVRTDFGSGKLAPEFSNLPRIFPEKDREQGGQCTATMKRTPTCHLYKHTGCTGIHLYRHTVDGHTVDACTVDGYTLYGYTVVFMRAGLSLAATALRRSWAYLLLCPIDLVYA